MSTLLAFVAVAAIVIVTPGQGSYALAVERASSLLGRPAVGRALDAVTGIVFVALGLRLATERR